MIDITRVAELLGATVVGRVPHCGGGHFGAARLERAVAELRAGLHESKTGSKHELVELVVDASVLDSLRAIATRESVPPLWLAARLLADFVGAGSTENAADTTRGMSDVYPRLEVQSHFHQEASGLHEPFGVKVPYGAITASSVLGSRSEFASKPLAECGVNLGLAQIDKVRFLTERKLPLPSTRQSPYIAAEARDE